MNVLFISRAKNNGEISPIVKTQAKSLEKLVNLSYYVIRGRGLLSYFKAITGISRIVKQDNIDIIHAHYALCGFTASLSSLKPVVCSLMGSDIEDSALIRMLSRLFASLCWEKTITKSENLKHKSRIPGIIVIPNGVDLNAFNPAAMDDSRKHLGIDLKKRVIFFPSDTSRAEKNFHLAKAAINLLTQKYNIELLTAQDIAYETMCYYYNASDVVLLTSRFEGSPNAIKEAMACNVPAVSTKVGDVEDLFEGVKGYFISNSDPGEIAENLIQALEIRKLNYPVYGRDKIIRMNLDNDSIAQKILEVYKSALTSDKKLL